MEIIIKPTALCNFNCTFCSASDMNIQHPYTGEVPKKIKDFIQHSDTTGLIVTGGEPLMVRKEYYYELHEITDCQISITSNLKNVYLHPEYWAPLLNEPWFNVATSFHYGNTRMWDENRVYDETLFRKVIKRYQTYVNKHVPVFIAVIDEENEHRAMDHVYLAMDLGTQVRLNNAIKVGKQGKGYQRYKMFQLYLDIIDKKLDAYEINCSQRFRSMCPYSTGFECGTAIRCCYVDRDDRIHISTCDEQLAMGNELPEAWFIPDKTVGLIKPSVEELIHGAECYGCELFGICNGCKTNRYTAQDDPNYCSEMKKLKDRIVASGWDLDGGCHS